MATYTAKVNTPYGVIEVEHDGTPSDQELIQKALTKVKQNELLKNFETSETPQELAVTKAKMPRDVEPIDEEEENLRADVVQNLSRLGSGPLGLVKDAINGAANLVGADKNLISDEYFNATKREFVRGLGALVGVKPEDVLTEEGEYKPMTTTAGAALQVVPYIAGGAGAAKAIGTVAPKLPVLFNGILSGLTVDQVLYEKEDGAIANVLQEADIPAEGMLKDLLEFMAIQEDDTVLEQRLKIALEGMAIGGTLEGFIRGVKGGKDFIFPSNGTVEEQVDAATKYLKDSRQEVQVRNSEVHSDLKFSETPEGVAQIEQQASGPINRFMRQVFTSRGYFTQQAYNLFRGKEYAERQLVREAENISNRLTKSLDRLDYTIPEETLNDFFTGRNLERMELEIAPTASREARLEWIAADMGIPREVASELIKARELIDSLSSRLANSSIPNEEFREGILENVGEYVRRSYRMFEDTNFKPDENLKHQVVKQLQDAKIADGLDEAQAYEEALGEVNAILDKRTDFAGLDYFSRAVRVNREILTGRKDIDPMIRELMGEITDPADNILLTVSKMAKLVETNKFADNLKTLATGKYIFNSPVSRNGVDYNVKISGTNSGLDGTYTTKEMATALQGRQSHFALFDNDLLRSFAALKGGSQAMKTVASHVTHLRNVLGGAQFGLANGINPFFDRQETFKVLVNAAKAKGDEGLDKLYEKYLSLGVINTNVRVGEFRRLLQEGSEINIEPRQLFDRLQGYGLGGIEEKIKVPAKAGRSAYRAAEKVYMAVDDFYKINAFNKELSVLKEAFPDEALEVLEQRAATIVQDTFPNYDKVPNGVKALRYLPVGSFVSFPAEIIRTSTKIVKQASDEITSGNAQLRARGLQRLAGFTTSMSAWEGMAITAGTLAGLTPEEQESVQNISHTPWSKATRIPYRGEDGQLYVADTQFLDSYSVLKEPIKEVMHRIQSGQLKGEALDKYMAEAVVDGSSKLLAPYLGQSIITESISDLTYAAMNDAGRSPSGEQLFPENETRLNKAITMFEHLGSAMMPGSLNSVMNVIDAGQGAKRAATGTEKKDLSAELLANFTGVKFSKLDPADNLFYAAQDYMASKRGFMKGKPDYEVEPEELQRRVKLNLEANYSAQQDLYLKVEAARDLIGTERTYEMLVNGGLSRKAALALMNNHYYDSTWADQNMAGLLKMPGTNEEMQETIQKITEEQLKYRYSPLIPVDEESVRARNERDRLARGGEVTNVPNAPMEPDERINKVTGLPYNETAGPAFMDEEDPMRRLQLSEGGITRRFAVAKGGLPKDMYRRDGSIKSAQGFLGPVKNLETGKTMTELSIDLEIGGKNVQIPTMVPTLTSEEIEILQSQNWEGRAKELPRSIVRKAVDHARKRMDAGLNPFYQDDEGREGKAKGGKIDKKSMACNSPRRTPSHPKKSHVVKACEGGKEKIIRFGEQGAKTAGKPKAGESARMKAKRKSFKARHRRNIKRGKMSAAYWADKVKW